MLLPLTPAQADWVTATLGSLSRREKIGQTVQERWNETMGRDVASLRDYFVRFPLGGLFCGGEIIKGAGNSVDAIRQGIALCQSATSIPLLIAGDLESGAGCAVAGLTRFPQALSLGACNDESLAYLYGKITAQQGRAAGFNWTFAPVLDLARNWLSPVVGMRSLGSNPDRVARLGSAFVRGLQEHGVAGCAKHFPGDGVDFRDQHLVTSVNSLAEEPWFQQDGKVFSSVISAGVYSAMSGHIALPWADPPIGEALRPRPASVSPVLLNSLLRERLGFTGAIVTDALEMGGFTGWALYEERVIAAFNAGNDVMLWPGEKYFEVVERALNDGRVSEERLDASVRRILEMKARLGLNAPSDVVEQASPVLLPDGELAPAHRAEAESVARQVAAKSLTLVRNRKGLLPLDRHRTRRILLHFATAPTTGWRDSLEPLAALLRGRGIEITLLENGNCLDVWNLETTGKRWDAYIVVFSQQVHQMKNTIRPVGSMAEVLWTLQNAETVDPIVVSLGTPFLLRELPGLDTLVNAYSPNAYTLEALVAALFGELPLGDDSPVDVGGNWY